MSRHIKIKVFTSSNISILEKEVNEFLHPLDRTRIGTTIFSAANAGMVVLYSVMVQYVEVPEKDDE